MLGICIGSVLIIIIRAMSAYACPMTSEQVKAIENISAATNTSNATLQSLFAILCDKYNVSQSHNLFYNQSQVDMKLKDYYNITEIRGNWTVFNDTWNNSIFTALEQTRIAINDYTDRFIDAYNETLSGNIVKFEDQLSEKLATAKTFSATRDELNLTKLELNSTINNLFSQMSSNVARYIEDKTSPWRYAMWGFMSAGFTVLGVAFLVTRKPVNFKPKITGFPMRRHTLEEIVTDTDLKRRIDIQRSLKLESIKTVKPMYREEIFRKIDNGSITNMDELNQEIEILAAKDLKNAPTGTVKKKR